MNLKKGQKVIVIAGDDKGKSGKVLRLSKNGSSVWVEGLNIITKHVKPNPTLQIKGGIIKIEAKIHISNVAVLKNSTEVVEQKKEKAETKKEIKSKKASSTKSVEKETK